jgi:4-hydroxy-2-oxoheptanedioate aldolase
MVSIDSIRDRWAEGNAVTGFWTAIPSPFSAELPALYGDYVCIDQQHGLIDYQMYVNMLNAVVMHDCAAITRVPANEPWIIGKALDAGAFGVVVPMVSTAKEAARAVEGCQYPPDGVRSFGPIRAAIQHGTGDPAVLGRALCIVMVETPTGVENVAEIARTPGVDAIYVGPADLALGLGLRPGLSVDNDVHRQAIDEIHRACMSAGIVAGIQCDSGRKARAWIDRGFRMVTVGKDSTMLQRACAMEMAVARGAADANIDLGYT